MADYDVTVQTSTSGPWEPAQGQGSIEHPERLPLETAERMAYGAYETNGFRFTAVRIANAEHAFTWRRHDDGRPRPPQVGRVDVQINGRWYHYCDTAGLVRPEDVTLLAERAITVPEAQIVSFGGDGYVCGKSGQIWA